MARNSRTDMDRSENMTSLVEFIRQSSPATAEPEPGDPNAKTRTDGQIAALLRPR